MNIAHNLERNHRLFPHKLALIFEENHLTYQELNTLSNQIANGLATYGIVRGDRVAIFLPNIPAFISSYFAIQKLGAVAVTLNSGLKAQETTFMLNDCQAKIVITTAALRPQLDLAELPHVKQIFIAEGEAGNDKLLSDLISQASSQCQAIDLERDDPAAILYTSGTTGFPKGATLSQGNIVSNVRLTMYTLRLAADDRVLLFLPAFHNYGQYATFNSCFDAGATLILHREFEPKAILDSIVHDKVTTFFGVPTIYTLLYDKATPVQFASIKRFISAGASLPLEISNKWQAKFGLVINQIYGLTECSMACFNHYFEPRPGTIGTPVEGTDLKIVNSDGQTVAQGELGEIVVRGPSVMLGYWNRPEATAEAIRDGWFYTGDMGRQDELGYVTIVDRRKDMVNVGGEKVYPSEVEQLLYQHPAVLEAAVYGVPETLMGEEVRANVILKAGESVTAEALMEFCRQALADYKVPSVIKFVESLPKGRTGKVLKRVLREEQAVDRRPQTVETGHALSLPSTSALITWLTQWLRENLGEAVAADKPFNEYGLTSLLAVKLVAALNKWLGTVHEPMMVWNYPTIETLVNYLTQTFSQTASQPQRMELWPAIDPYHVYDSLMYQRMRNDTARTEIYRLAIEQHIADKVVLEIGPGPEVNLTRLCVEAGAKHVYAVELDETACRQAQILVNQLGLANKITLIHGDVTQITLPELAEACVSGLAGQIGGSEGVVALINKAKRLLTPDALIIPQRYVSQIAAVTMPDLPLEFTPLGWQYAHKIFDQVGHPFDLRVIINRFETSAIISDKAIFEEIDFSPQNGLAEFPTSYKHNIRLTITSEQSRLDGFIIWLNLHTVAGVMIDVLEQGDLWLPVYFPTFHPGVTVTAGDVIEATCIGSLSDNQINPDYRLMGRLIRQDGSIIEFDHQAPHHAAYFRQTPFYKELFQSWQVESKRQTVDASTPYHLPSTPNEPIAIIGMGCRLPGGADTLDKFWEILQHGVDTVAEIPADRWDIERYYDPNPEALGKMYTKTGSFLTEVDKFDAAFFGLPPLDARSLDPQQRMLLEVTWEALENAGLSPHELRHSQTGMFIGSFWDDYSTLNLYHDAPENIDAYRILSNLRGMHSGRLSYIFQFHGPSMQIDTACSSSLLAIHLACQSLRAQECHLAIAGGATLFLSPEVMIGLSRTHAISADGRSKPFAANADGFGVGEGVGAVVLKRLSDAQRDGDNILAVIRGSAVNHDGPSNGLTAPNGLAQEAMLRQALQSARLSPDKVDYIETHSTGTVLGDPIEIDALARVFAPNRPYPLMIGSVKSNIGHLSAAAGMASLLKVVLSMQHGLIPPSLHFSNPNPHIRWQELRFMVPTHLTTWPRPTKLAGISSVGMTGTNVHVIVEASQSVSQSASQLNRPTHLLTLSGKNEQALHDQVARYRDYLAHHPELDLGDVCYTANTGRAHFEHRLAVVADNLDELIGELGVRRQELGDKPLTPNAQFQTPKVSFLFTGQGLQYVDMGRELFETQPLFRQIMTECNQILRPYLDVPLLELLYPGSGEKGIGSKSTTNNLLLDETHYTQPALFALEYALAKLWQSWGIEPELVMGHSVGEFVAACVAGVFSLEDGLKLITARGRLMQQLCEKGSMVAVPLDEAKLQPFLEPYLEQISIANYNSSQNLVISGQSAAIQQIVINLQADGVKCTLLKVFHAFHSPLMTPMLAEFARVAEDIHYQPPQIKLISNLTGEVITKIDATYWVAHVSAPVRFAQGMATLFELGFNTFIEIGPKPTLLGLGQQSYELKVMSDEWKQKLKTQNSSLITPLWLPSLCPKQHTDWRQMLESLGALYVHGVQVNWRKFDEPYSRHKVSLPTYPFQRKRYWLNPQMQPYQPSPLSQPLQDLTIAQALVPSKVTFRQQIVAAPVEERLALLKNHIRAEIETILGVIPKDEQSFLELGLDSLMSIQFGNRLAASLGVSLPLKLIFEQNTVAQLAQQISLLDSIQPHLVKHESSDFLHQTQIAEPLPQLTPDLEGRYEPFPLTDIQEAYWLGRREMFDFHRATHFYQEFACQGLEPLRLERTWQSLIERHDMLRAIVLPNGQQQVLAETPLYKIKIYDLTAATESTITTHLATIRSEMFNRVFPTNQWPLFEVKFTLLPIGELRIHFNIDMLLVDLGSYAILLREWAQLYHQPTNPLPELRLSFRDYVLAEKQLTTLPLYHQARTYWLERLKTLPPAPELPLNPNALLTAPFKRHQQILPPEIWSALKTQATKLGVTPTGLLLTIFAEILTRWSKQPQFTLNLTLFNRLPLAEQVNQIVGDFTSLTMLAIDNRHLTDTLAQRAKRIQSQLWQDLDHRYYNGTQVLRELTKKGGGQTFMPIVFTSGLGVLEAAAQGLGQNVYWQSETAQVWLDHQIFEAEGNLWLIWDAVEALFPDSLISSMFESYVKLLEQLATDTALWQATTLNVLPLVQHEQRLAVNNTQAALSDELLHTLFIKQAQVTPDNLAVIAPNRTLTYQELYQSSQQVAGWLQAHEAKPNTLVAVVMEKGWEQVVAVLGILMSGAAYLPIDPDLPIERQHYLLAQGEVKLALTQTTLATRLTWPSGLEVLTVDTLHTKSLLFCEVTTTPTDLAYVIYTSGSTGLPKGVMIDHRGAVNTILDINQRFGVTATDRVLALSALNFDLSVYDIFGLLAVGGAIVMPLPTGRRDPSHWMQLMTQHGVTLWDTVPALMHMVVEYLMGQSVKIPLRLVMMSGDWIPVDLPTRIKQLWPHLMLMSLGGATEASIWSIYYPIEQLDPHWTSVPYGKPLTNQTFHVLNQRLEPCPVWVPGELYIGGIGLALGYWRDPERSAASFITHPYTGERLYKTGDLGRYRPDGNIEFLGREDFQVKIRGHRIELGEIESHLLKHSQVKEAVVSAIGSNRHDKQLVAYIVPQTDSAPQNSHDDQAAYGLKQMQGVLTDPVERLQFKLKQPGVRHFDTTHPIIKLPASNISDSHYIERQSYRQFEGDPLTITQLGQLLACLSPRHYPHAVLPKYRYGSAGSLYPVQMYIYLKPDRVAGLAGFYYYHPVKHELILISNAQIERNRYDGMNQTIFDQATFALFLVAELQAIEPMYGAMAREFCVLEAGYISQLLMMDSPRYDVGLCPIGGLDFEPLRQPFGLTESQHMVHSFLGGPISTAQKQQLPQLSSPAQGEGGVSLEAELKDYLSQKLPTYMVPNIYLTLEQLPLSANGKVDRQALPPPDKQPTALEGVVLPTTELEQQLTEIVQRVLHVPQLSMTTNFFDLGTDSLQLVQLYNEITAKLHLNITVADVFRFPTVQTLAELLAKSTELLEKPNLAQPITEIDPEQARHLRHNLDNIADDDLDSLLALF